MPSLKDFYHNQFVLKIPEPSTSCASKIVLVTGATGGLGQEVVKWFVRLGASKVICACRSVPSGERVKRYVEAASRCGSDVIEVWQLDLESPSSIATFVGRADKLPRLDIVAHLAGVACVKHEIVYDTERTLAVNNIGTFLLALPLIPKLQETARAFDTTPVMTIVSSALYDAAKYPEHPGADIFAYFKDESKMSVQNQYNLSKLIQLYTLIKLASIIDPVDEKTSADGYPIVINSLDPCFCKTGLHRDLSGAMRLGAKAFAAIAARPADDGARQIVHTATCGRETHGLYMRGGALQAYAPVAQDEGRKEYLWNVLCARLKKLDPSILDNLE